MQVIETGASDVDKVRIKRMRVAKSTLLRIGGLVAILEAAAICHAAKNAGDKLGIVHETEPVE